VRAYSFAHFPRRAVKWLSITIVVAAIVPVLLLSTRRSPAPAVSSRLELARALPFTLVAEGERLSLGWDREAPAIQAGVCGVLWIADGGIHRRLVLDASQLRAGKLFYWPVNKDVSFEFTMAGGNADCAKDATAPLPPPVEGAAHQDRRSGRPTSRNRPMAVRKAQSEGTESSKSGSVSAYENRRIESSSTPTFAVEGESQQVATLFVHAIQVPAASERQLLPAAINPTPQMAPEPYSTVSVEAVPETRLSHIVSKIPLLRRLHRTAEIVPPRPLHETTPAIPAELRRTLKSEVPLDVRAFVDEWGKVTYAEIASNVPEGERGLASLAVFDARHWEFTPAQLGGQPVPGQVILRYRFGNPLVAGAGNQAR